MEVLWASSIKSSHGFTRLAPTVLTFVLMAVSIWLLSLSMKTLPLGTAYVIWTGIGAIGAFIVGLVFYDEPASLLRIFAAILIVSGLVLMKITSKV